MSRSGHRTRPLLILHSFRGPVPSTNPYLVMLRDAIESLPGTQVRTFTWKRAIFGRYDIFHVHWPENILVGSTRLKSIGIHLAADVFLARLRITRVPIVRTVHNIGIPTGLPPWRRRWIEALDRATTVRIRLTDLTPVDDPDTTITIPHGHYRDWFATSPAEPIIPGRLGYFGLIKPYKGVERLIEVFRELPGELQLRVGGRPTSAEVGDRLRELARPDPRIGLTLEYLSDAELVSLVSSSELIVLPYRHMHNSGSVLAALSIGRPVLVPDNEVNRRLVSEVGGDWIQLFDGELGADRLASALAVARAQLGSGAPDLSAREWDDAGLRHVEGYRLALSRGARRYS